MAIKDLAEKVIFYHSKEMGDSLKANKDKYDNFLHALEEIDAFEKDQAIDNYDVNIVDNVNVEVYFDADYIFDKTDGSPFDEVMSRCDIFRLSVHASKNTMRLHFVFNNIWKDHTS